MTRPCRGVILPTVLFVLLLVGLLGAMFAFRVNADLASTQATAYRVQTRLAAEAGIERVKLLLRSDRLHQDVWYDNPDELHRIVVWGDGVDETVVGTNEEFDGTMAYRFSIVADDPTDDEKYVRFGITDESSKLNLNVATDLQLLTLVKAAVDDPEIDAGAIVDAILDWRDTDGNPRGEAGDTEAVYYEKLDRPYRVKNGPFDTVEELLLVKGVTNRLLYGEDVDRNGLLTPNEDDGDASFPSDNQDGVLNRGLYPYLTVSSVENNVNNENRPRIYLFGDQNELRKALEDLLDGDQASIDYIVTATRGAGGKAIGGAGDDASTVEEGKPGGDQDVKETNAEATGDTPDQQEADVGDENGDSAGGDKEQDANPPADESRDRKLTIRTPAGLMLMRAPDGELVPSPVSAEQLPLLMDGTTTVPPGQRKIEGLININTAPAPVLRCLPGLSDEQIASILEVRDTLGSDDKATPAWLVTEDVVDITTFERIGPLLTARGQQFMIEALGYGDHTGMVTRLEVIVDMVGPMPQTIYYRDVTRVGSHFPIREEDRENIRVR